MAAINWIETLEKSGYKVGYDGAILYFTVSPEEYENPNAYKTLAKLIKDVGYNKSWGVKPERKQNGNGEN